MKFEIKKSHVKEIMAIELVQESLECVAVKINGEGVIYFNNYQNGTAHLYEDKIKALGIEIKHHN